MTSSPFSSGRVFCSDAARLRGDDNSATASRVDVWILVELPLTWGREPIVDAAIPPAVRQSLQHATDSIPNSRLVFIRKRVHPPAATRVYVVRSSGTPVVATRLLDSLEDVSSLSFGSMLESAKSSESPIVLVCTHGQHDSCCGRRGYPLFEALQERSGIEVWQCSHIGGDRFAANAVVLPWGLYYGPVEARDADFFASTILEGDIFINGFRGRSTVPRVVQAAEIHVRRVTGMAGRDDLELIGRERTGDTEVVRLRDAQRTTYAMTIERYVASEAAKLTCLAQSTSPVPQFRVVGYEAVAEDGSPAATQR